jgi:indole-3-glycerol phosphate synthase
MVSFIPMLSLLKDFIIFPKMISPIFVTEMNDIQVILNVLQEKEDFDWFGLKQMMRINFKVGIEFVIAS